MKPVVIKSRRFSAITILWLFAVHAIQAQDGRLVKETANRSTEEFGGIEEVMVVDTGGDIEFIELQEPLGVLAALETAESEMGANISDGAMTCLEFVREEIENRTDVRVLADTDTVIIGDALKDPCNVIVVTGGLTITITETEVRTLFYRLQVHLGARASCALRLTAFSFDAATGETFLTWESIPQSKYTMEVSTDLIQWEELERDIPSEGSSTTATLATDKGDARELYFRTRLQLDSLRDPVP